MKAYKLQLAFEDLNQVIDFYKIGLKKEHNRVMDKIVGMGSKGWITTNPDNTLTVTWYTRTLDKYNTIVDAYVKCKVCPDYYIPDPNKMDYAEDI